jgi:hypothetical protein
MKCKEAGKIDILSNFTICILHKYIMVTKSRRMERKGHAAHGRFDTRKGKFS